MSDFNSQVIDEFRTNEGRVGGPFEGSPLALVHHVGRKSGTERVVPLVYLAHDSDPRTIYIFASKAGAPTHPDWYHNLLAAGRTTVEVGTETYEVTVRELDGEERDRVYAEQAGRFENFADYAHKTEGIRTIPVLELTRA